MLQVKSKELENAVSKIDGLYEDWKNGDIDRAQYLRMRARYDEQTSQLNEAVERIQAASDALAKGVRKEDPCLTSFLKYRNVTELTRGLLVELIDVIYVHEGGAIDIQFNYADQYRRILELAENSKLEPQAVGE